MEGEYLKFLSFWKMMRGLSPHRRPLKVRMRDKNLLYGLASTGYTSFGIIQDVCKTEIELIDISIVIQDFEVNKNNP